MSEKLLPCPICQGQVQWCDFDGEKVSGECCDNIECKSCGLLFQFDDRSEHGRDTLSELQADNLKAFNTRHLSESVEAVLEAAKNPPPINISFHTDNTEMAAFLKWAIGVADASAKHDKGRK